MNAGLSCGILSGFALVGISSVVISVDPFLSVIVTGQISSEKILFLDEATSHLDSQSEYHIQESINSLPNDMTVIIIAHRLSTVKHADQILVVHEVCDHDDDHHVLEDVFQTWFLV